MDFQAHPMIEVVASLFRDEFNRPRRLLFAPAGLHIQNSRLESEQ